MKILFSLGSFGFLRNFEPAVRLLAQRGHDIHLVADRTDNVGGIRTLEVLERDYPARIRHSYVRAQKDGRWLPLATQLRLTLDYWRYLDPRYDHSPSLRARGASQAPAIASSISSSPLLASRTGRALMRRLKRCSGGPPAQGAAGSPARHAAPVFRIAAGRHCSRGARAWHPNSPWRRQLGPPDDERPHSRAAGSRDRVE